MGHSYKLIESRFIFQVSWDQGKSWMALWCPEENSLITSSRFLQIGGANRLLGLFRYIGTYLGTYICAYLVSSSVYSDSNLGIYMYLDTYVQSTPISWFAYKIYSVIIISVPLSQVSPYLLNTSYIAHFFFFSKRPKHNKYQRPPLFFFYNVDFYSTCAIFPRNSRGILYLHINLFFFDFFYFSLFFSLRERSTLLPIPLRGMAWSLCDTSTMSVLWGDHLFRLYFYLTWLHSLAFELWSFSSLL